MDCEFEVLAGNRKQLLMLTKNSNDAGERVANGRVVPHSLDHLETFDISNLISSFATNSAFECSVNPSIRESPESLLIQPYRPLSDFPFKRLRGCFNHTGEMLDGNICPGQPADKADGRNVLIQPVQGSQ